MLNSKLLCQFLFKYSFISTIKKTSIEILVFKEYKPKIAYFILVDYLAEASAIESFTKLVTSSEVLVTTS